MHLSLVPFKNKQSPINRFAMRRILAAIVGFILYLPAFPQQRIQPKNIEIVRDGFGVPHLRGYRCQKWLMDLPGRRRETICQRTGTMLPVKNLMGRVQGKERAGDYAFALFRCRRSPKNGIPEPGFIKLAEGYVQGASMPYARKHPEEVLHEKLFPSA